MRCKGPGAGGFLNLHKVISRLSGSHFAIGSTGDEPHVGNVILFQCREAFLEDGVRPTWGAVGSNLNELILWGFDYLKELCRMVMVEIEVSNP